MKLLKDRRGAAQAAVVGLVGIFAVIFVGLIVLGNLQATSEAMDLGTEGNLTRTTLVTNTHTGFSLLVLTPIILAASVILAILRTFGGA